MNFADGPRAAALSAIDLPIFRRVVGVLTEQEVLRSWRKLFKGGEHDESSLNRAEALLDELRAESPLRHRLMTELDELRKLRSADAV